MTPAAYQLREKIENKSAVIGIVGLGYVGLPLAVEFAEKGFRTVGIDLSQRKVKSLKQGENYIADIPAEKWRKVVDSGRFQAQTDYSGAAQIDVFYICVPTPFTENKEPDISYIVSAARSIKEVLRPGQLIILKSTTFPNTTEGYVRPVLDETGLVVGKDYFLAFSPERIDPGNAKWHTGNTPIVVGGVTPVCTALTAQVTRQIVDHVHEVSSPKVAEMEKLLENIFRSVNIALVNELAQMCDRMGGINVWEVIQAAATKPFGFMPFWPGPGIGGHCILIDPYYLSWYAKAYDFHSDFIELAAKTNESMPFYVRDAIIREIAHAGVPLKQAKILVLGIAFKKNVDDTRHSPAIRVMELLLQEGLSGLTYHDPFVPETEICGKNFQSTPLTEIALKEADLVVITTDHTQFDLDFIARHSQRIYDTRNAVGTTPTETRISVLGDGKS
ncbi:MAG: nucleotide sugar dehydrogenase [Bacteroidetes bacterium]|nr:nucleotide sugar dehydrogenase [Bacteroidota bacterium]